VPPVRHAVGNTVNTRGDRRHNRYADRLVYSPYNGSLGSVPFAPFAGGGDTLVAAAVVTMCISSYTVLYRGVVWVNITAARNPS